MAKKVLFLSGTVLFFVLLFLFGITPEQIINPETFLRGEFLISIGFVVIIIITLFLLLEDKKLSKMLDK